jgi:hypothetical protein
MTPDFHIHASVSDKYIPRIGPLIFCSRIGRSIVGIYYKSLTDTPESGNWDGGRAIRFLGIFVSNFRKWFFAVYMYVAIHEDFSKLYKASNYNI